MKAGLCVGRSHASQGPSFPECSAFPHYATEVLWLHSCQGPRESHSFLSPSFLIPRNEEHSSPTGLGPCAG